MPDLYVGARTQIKGVVVRSVLDGFPPELHKEVVWERRVCVCEAERAAVDRGAGGGRWIFVDGRGVEAVAVSGV